MTDEPRIEGIRVGELLQHARDRAGLSIQQLALRAGASRSAVHRYESGSRSPSTRVFDQLLAACGLQARVRLEPLRAALDERVDALEGPVPELDVPAWTRLAASLEDQEVPGSASLLRSARRGPVTWAVDGASALVLHQLAVEPEAPEVVVLLDEALRFWMRSVGLMGRTERERVVQDWLDADPERIQDALDGVRYCMLGLVRVRVVNELPRMSQMLAPWSESPVLVATVDEVERTSLEHGELLSRWRARRAGWAIGP